MRTIYNQVVDVAPLTTVVEPLRYRAFAAAWSKGEDSDLGYLFSHQLAEADIIAVNKIDMVSGDVLVDTLRALRDRYPKARLVSYSGLSGDGLPTLVQQWQQAPTPNGTSRSTTTVTPRDPSSPITTLCAMTPAPSTTRDPMTEFSMTAPAPMVAPSSSLSL
jgi:G3E family GTPase